METFGSLPGMQDCLATAAPPMFGALADKEPSNHGAMWEGVLRLAAALPESWSHINVHKAMLPHLWSLLRHGCRGSAPTSFPAVLPLITLLPMVSNVCMVYVGASCPNSTFAHLFFSKFSHALDTCVPYIVSVPQDILTTAFFEVLLSAVWEGLQQDGSREGQHAASACFEECLVWALVKAEQLPAGGARAQHENGATLFRDQLLKVAVQQLLCPTILGGGNVAHQAAAQRILVNALGKLQQLRSNGRSAGEAEVCLECLLQHVGAALVGAVAGLKDSSSGQQLGDNTCNHIAQLATAMASAGEQSSAAVALHIAGPLMAELLPVARSGSTSAGTAMLLATLINLFPQTTAEADAAPATGPPACGMGTQLSLTAVLQDTAGLIVDSMLAQLQQGGDVEALWPHGELLLSCILQLRDGAARLAAVLSTLLAVRAQQVVVMLIQRAATLDDAWHLRSSELDSILIAECSLSLTGAAVDELPNLLTPALIGNGERSLLSDDGILRMLRQLLHTLEAPDVTTAAQVAILKIVRATVFSSALDGSSISSTPASVEGEVSAQLMKVRLDLLVEVFSVLAQGWQLEVTLEGSILRTEGHGSDDEGSYGSESGGAFDWQPVR
jgi:hypothetical protein